MENIRNLLDIHVTKVFHFIFLQDISLNVGGGGMHTSHPSTWKVEAGISGVQDQSQLLRGFKANLD